METSTKEGKVLFIILSLTAFCLVLGSIIVLIYLLEPRLNQLSPAAFSVIEILLWISIALFGLWFVLSAATALLEKPVGLFKTRPLLFHWLVPITLFVGKLLRIDHDTIARSFISLNNALIQSTHKKVPEETVLILLPHCLQNAQCVQKVVENISYCKSCGRCEISIVKALSERYHCPLYLTPGGTLARRIIKKTTPEAIIAVACETELLSGITDTWRIPVIGLPNRRPEGPCKNTRLGPHAIEGALKMLTDNSH